MSECSVCKTNKNAGYKCRKCRIPYCSVNCYKEHTRSNCEEPKVDEPKDDIVKYKYETEDTVPIEKLNLLNQNESLKNILANKHVRDILNNINNCDKPNEILEQAMKESYFVDFVDECLKTVENNKSN